MSCFFSRHTSPGSSAPFPHKGAMVDVVEILLVENEEVVGVVEISEVVEAGVEGEVAELISVELSVVDVVAGFIVERVVEEAREPVEPSVALSAVDAVTGYDIVPVKDDAEGEVEDVEASVELSKVVAGEEVERVVLDEARALIEPEPSDELSEIVVVMVLPVEEDGEVVMEVVESSVELSEVVVKKVAELESSFELPEFVGGILIDDVPLGKAEIVMEVAKAVELSEFVVTGFVVPETVEIDVVASEEAPETVEESEIDAGVSEVVSDRDVGDPVEEVVVSEVAEERTVVSERLPS